MEQIVFFWVGKKLSIPEFLVNSIRILYGKKIKIIQLSDENTRKIHGVDEVLRNSITGNLMTDRLNLYSLVKTENNLTIFLDADSLLIQKLKLNDFANGYHILQRETDSLSFINDNWPEYYPEFVEKTFKEIMPFLFGVIIINYQKSFFKELLLICNELPKRFHRWYGDQYSLKKLYDKNPEKFNLIKDNWVHVVSLNKDGNVDIKTSNYTKILTFKGNTKKYIKNVLESLKKL